MNWTFDDGGRAAAGYKGDAGDCVTRAIAIATGKPYQEVYDALKELAKRERRGKRKRGVSKVRDGCHRVTYDRYLKSLGWAWTPTMTIGSGCRVHLTDGELPSGRLIVRVSKHLTAVIDGVIRDTHNPQREVYACSMPVGVMSSADPHAIHTIQRRCVYGYYSKP